MSTPQTSTLPKPNKFLDFGPQPEHLIEEARNQVKAGRKQYLESLSGRKDSQAKSPRFERAPEDLIRQGLNQVKAVRKQYLESLSKQRPKEG